MLYSSVSDNYYRNRVLFQSTNTIVTANDYRIMNDFLRLPQTQYVRETFFRNPDAAPWSLEFIEYYFAAYNSLLGMLSMVPQQDLLKRARDLLDKNYSSEELKYLEEKHIILLFVVEALLQQYYPYLNEMMVTNNLSTLANYEEHCASKNRHRRFLIKFNNQLKVIQEGVDEDGHNIDSEIFALILNMNIGDTVIYEENLITLCSCDDMNRASTIYRVAIVEIKGANKETVESFVYSINRGNPEEIIADLRDAYENVSISYRVLNMDNPNKEDQGLMDVILRGSKGGIGFREDGHDGATVILQIAQTKQNEKFVPHHKPEEIEAALRTFQKSKNF